MANYENHLKWGIISAVVVGLGVGWMGLSYPKYLPLVIATAAIASLAPDVDSNSSRPLQIIFQGAAFVIPPILIWRIRILHTTPEIAILSWLVMGAIVLYPMKWVFKKFTIHRGVFHSIPAAIIFGLICFLIARNEGMGRKLQLGLAIAGFSGYMTHLILDELWAVDFNGKKLKMKKSFGTAICLTSPGIWNNVALYFTLVAISWLSIIEWYRLPLWPLFNPKQMAFISKIIDRLLTGWL